MSLIKYCIITWVDGWWDRGPVVVQSSNMALSQGSQSLLRAFYAYSGQRVVYQMTGDFWTALGDKATVFANVHGARCWYYY